MQKHEGNQATIYYLDMLGYIIVGIPLLLLLPASGIIQHPAGASGVAGCSAVRGGGAGGQATRKTRCQGYPALCWPAAAVRVRGASSSQGTVIMHIPDPGPALPPAPPPSCRPISCIYTDTGHCPAPMTHCGHCIHCILYPCWPISCWISTHLSNTPSH